MNPPHTNSDVPTDIGQKNPLLPKPKLLTRPTLGLSIEQELAGGPARGPSGGLAVCGS
jgi:hypothetical protein